MCASWNTAAAVETNQDDSWADFGGFESAQPVPQNLSSSVASGTLSWVTGIPAASTTPQRQDGIPGESVVPPASNQNSAPTLPWASFPATSASSALQGIPDVVKTEAVSTSMPWGVSMGVADQGSPGHAAAPERTDDSMPWNQAPDSSTSTSRDSLPGQDQNMPWEVTSTSSESSVQSASAAMSDVPWGVYPSTAASAPTQTWPGDVSSSQNGQNQTAVDGGPVQITGAGVQRNVQGVAGPTSVPDFVKQREKELLDKKTKECESLQEKNKALESELEHQRIILQEQNKKYDALQTKHQDQLKVLRDSGQEAFALIVEEYKQLSKTAVEEQKEQCLRYMKDALEEERKTCEKLLQEQHEYLKTLLDQEREQNEQRVETAVKDIKETYESQMASAVEEERKLGQEHLNQAVQEEKEQREKALEEFVEKEKKALEQLSKEHKDETQSFLEGERQACNDIIKEALEQEQRNVKQMLEDAVKEERKKAEEMVKQTLEMTKKEMDNYVEQRLKDDAVKRQKYLLSMDLFLEGTRTQLRSLMEEEQNSQDGEQTD